MPNYGKHRSHGLTKQSLQYWASEYRRLRIGPQLGISFDTFLRLRRTVRHNVQRWAETQLHHWRENLRWLPMTCTPWVLDWTTDAPADAEATIDPEVATLRKICPN